MRLIGLTGRSGSGKSTVGDCARAQGIPCLDCDAIYREVTSHPGACLTAIRDTFGADTVRDGALYRPALRQKVFSDPEAMRQLNALTAQYLSQEVLDRLQPLAKELAILDAPTLFACGMDVYCEQVLGVLAPDSLCIQRIMRRDGIDEAAARQRLAQQPSNAFFAQHCDVLLYNEGSEDAFRADAIAVLQALKTGEKRIDGTAKT